MLQNNPAGELELALRIRALVEGQNAIVGLGRSFLEINRSIESLMLGLKSVSGSIEGANNEFAFLTSVALKTGLSIETLGQNYLKLTAASKGTMLEGDRVRTLFAQTSDALMKLGSDSINTTRAMNALAQMMSKGQIYSEELKGQLAEAIPGALNIMSRALRLSVQEMLNLMEQGLLTSDALVLFGNQLKTEFGGGTENVRTFNQVINDVINQWTLLMKGIGDSGPWSLLKTLIGGLGTSMDLLAAAAGAGLGVALAKAAIGIKNITVNTQEAIASLGANVAAHRANASATLDSARSALAAAQAAQTEARAIAQAALAQAQSAQGTVFAANTQRILAAARADLAIKTGLLISAEQRLVIAENAVIGSATLSARAMGLLFGPVGMIATAIGMAATFALSFGDIGESADIAEQSLLEYSKTVQNMTNAELVSSIAKLDAAEKEAAANVKRKTTITELAKIEEDYARARQKLGATEAELIAAQQQSIESSRELAKAQAEEEDAARKLDLTRAALIGRVGEMMDSEQRLAANSTELRIKQEELHAETERLRAGLDDGTTSYQDYYAAQMKEIEVAGQLRDSDAKLGGVLKELAVVQLTIQQQAKANVDAYGSLVKGSQEYTDAVNSEADRIRDRYQELSKLTQRLAAAEVATRNLKAQTEAHATVSKAVAEALAQEAKSTEDTNRQRELAIKQRTMELDVGREQVVMLMQERTAIEANLALLQRELELGTKKEKETLAEIGALQNQLTLKNAEIEKRKENIETLRLERMEAVALNTTMGAALADINKDIALTTAALNEEKAAWEAATKSGQSMESLIPLQENIILLEQRLALQSQQKAIIMRQGWEAIGQSQEEAATGMDMQTRRMISAFSELAAKGNLSARQLTDSFTDVLGKANTLSELQAIEAGLLKLKDTGKYSTDLINQMMAELRVKMGELARAVDPVTKALDKFGLGVPERLKDSAAELKVMADLLYKTQGATEASNTAFMKYADTLIEAKLAGADVDLETLKMEASTKGLLTAVIELYEKRKLENNQNQILTGSLAALNRAYSLNAAAHEREAKVSEALHDLKVSEIEDSILVAKSKGNEIEASRLLIEKNKELVNQAYAMAQAKVNEVKAAENALTIKTFELTKDHELTLAEQELLSAMEAEIAVKKLAAQQAENHAIALEKESKAVEKNADVFDNAAKNAYKFSDAASDVAKRNAEVGVSAKKASDDLNDLNVAWASFQGEAAIGLGINNIVTFNRIIESIKLNIDKANQAAQLLAEEGIGAISDGGSQAYTTLEAMADSLINSKSYLNQVARAAGENLKSALKSAREEAQGLAGDLADMAMEFEKEILGIEGNKRKLAELEYQEKLAQLEDLHQKAGKISDDEYQDALKKLRELHQLKMTQLSLETDQDQEGTTRLIEKANRVKTAWGEVGEQVTQTYERISELGNSDLSRLERQMGNISDAAKGLAEVL